MTGSNFFILCFVFATFLVCSFCVDSSQAINCPEGLPSTIKPPSNHRHIVAKRSATGSQVYTCAVTTSGNQWTLVTPIANLYQSSKLRGTHFIGPTWQDCDGSFVAAARNSSADAPNPSEDIPWLLLSATSNSKKVGIFDDITWVVRSHTNGGVAPSAESCTSDKLGSVISVSYSSKYYFYKKGSSNCSK